MKVLYYSAAWTDSGFFLGCSHEHETIAEADSCIPCAGGYVVGVENGVMRSLTAEEESEFQRVHYAPRTDKPAAETTLAAPAEEAASDSRYAVMTPIWVIDHWTWATWMCFDTYAQAVAHTRKGSKVVRFRSPEWAALKQQEWTTQPQQIESASPIRANEGRESIPQRGEGETFVEFVLRLLDAYDLDQHAEPIPDVKHGSVDSGLLPLEGQKDDATCDSKQQMPMIEPAFMARMILSRLSELGIGQLELMCDDDIPALLDALQKRSHYLRQERNQMPTKGTHDEVFGG